MITLCYKNLVTFCNKLTLDKIILVIIVLLWSALPVWGARPYKTYVIRGYESWDILCEPYTVKKGDHIWEILSRKGCIAEHDFLRFVSTLKDLNPHIKNVDRIYPDQRLLIPLKKMKAKEGVPRPGPRYVTIPMIPDILYTNYTVRPGDCLFTIVTTHVGLPIEDLPKRYIQTLRRLNPGIKNINRIYPGQRIRIPELASAEITSPAQGSRVKGQGDRGQRTMDNGQRTMDAVSMAVKPLGGHSASIWQLFLSDGRESRS